MTEFILENGYFISGEDTKIKIPDDFFDEESTIYQIKTLLRSKIGSLPKNSYFNITNVSPIGRKIVCKDDDIYNIQDKLTFKIISPDNDGIPKIMKTGTNIEDRKLDTNMFIAELIDSINTKYENIINIFVKAINDLNEKTKEMLAIYDMNSTDLDGYEGEFLNGLPHGYGVRIRNRKIKYYNNIMENHTKYEGYWLEGKFEGQGKLTKYEKSDMLEVVGWHEGGFVNGDKSGWAKELNEDGLLEGEFFEGWIEGQAKMTYKDGSVYEGGWSMECRQGYGKLIDADGTTIYEGEWEDDEKKI